MVQVLVGPFRIRLNITSIVSPQNRYILLAKHLTQSGTYHLKDFFCKDDKISYMWQCLDVYLWFYNKTSDQSIERLSCFMYRKIFSGMRKASTFQTSNLAPCLSYLFTDHWPMTTRQPPAPTISATVDLSRKISLLNILPVRKMNTQKLKYACMLYSIHCRTIE